LHSKLASGSLLEKTNTAGSLSAISAAGPDSIVVVGAVWSSTVHVHSAGVGSTRRFGLVAWTSNV
jgi:hypothetical protein